MTREAWREVSSCPEDEVVETCIIEEGVGRMHQDLKRRGRLWFVSDGSMYVYYTPTHWRPKASK